MCRYFKTCFVYTTNRCQFVHRMNSIPVRTKFRYFKYHSSHVVNNRKPKQNWWSKRKAAEAEEYKFIQTTFDGQIAVRREQAQDILQKYGVDKRCCREIDNLFSNVTKDSYFVTSRLRKFKNKHRMKRKPMQARHDSNWALIEWKHQLHRRINKRKYKRKMRYMNVNRKY